MTIPSFVAIDVETTLNGNEDIGLAHPMHPDNKVVAFGIHHGATHVAGYDQEMFEHSLRLAAPEAIFCGHNISFDLMYLYKTSTDLKYQLQRHRIWDTQLAEYILSAQQTKFSSLDELSVKYGLPVKDDTIKKYFQAGLGSEKIPAEELLPYLQQDIANTRAIAVLQYEQAVKQNQLTLIMSQMEALHATTEMMFNGYKILPVSL